MIMFSLEIEKKYNYVKIDFILKLCWIVKSVQNHGIVKDYAHKIV